MLRKPQLLDRRRDPQFYTDTDSMMSKQTDLFVSNLFFFSALQKFVISSLSILLIGKLLTSEFFSIQFKFFFF
jgi:hypothetical protein